MHDSPQQRRILSSDTAALWLLGLAFTVLHLIAGARYGFHRDELLTYSNARHLDWCYVVYPPLTAWLARIELALFGTSLVGFRSFAAIAVGLAGVLCGLIARELGGGRRAMLLSCVVFSIVGSWRESGKVCVLRGFLNIGPSTETGCFGESGRRTVVALA